MWQLIHQHIPIIMVKQCPPADNCPICLAKITNEAIPDGCGHSFCHHCIKKWSIKQNTCPLCKTRFSAIITSKSRPSSTRRSQKASRRKGRRESVSGGSQQSEQDFMEECIINALCGRSTRKREDSMLMAYAFLQQMAIEE